MAVNLNNITSSNPYFSRPPARPDEYRSDGNEFIRAGKEKKEAKKQNGLSNQKKRSKALLLCHFASLRETYTWRMALKLTDMVKTPAME